jgi:HK97 gp10 family phage protein
MALEGLDKALQRTEELPRRLKGRKWLEALAKGPGRIFHRRAFELAPYDETREKGTHLRDALFIDAREHKAGQSDILVGVNRRKAPHAHLQEFGWEKKPEGSPYLRPAATQTRDACRAAVAAATKAAIEK